MDCINKPCYICGETTHSTTTCPHRIAPEATCTVARDAKKESLLKSLFGREFGFSNMLSAIPKPGKWAIDAAIIKLHARRTVCLEFHPDKPSIVLSGDKHGQVAVWDLDKVFERTVYKDEINKWLTNNIKYLKSSPSSDLFATTSYVSFEMFFFF